MNLFFKMATENVKIHIFGLTEFNTFHTFKNIPVKLNFLKEMESTHTLDNVCKENVSLELVKITQEGVV